MKMMLIAFLFFLSLNLYASIWDEMGEDERRSAQIGQRDGGKFDIRLRVVDVNGNPVKDVHCGGWAFRGSMKDLNSMGADPIAFRRMDISLQYDKS